MIQSPLKFNYKKTLLRATVVGALGFLLFKFVLHPYHIKIEGHGGGHQLRFVNMLSYKWTSPKVGDVVVVRIIGGNASVIGRVVAKGGQKLDTIGSQIFIDGRPIKAEKLSLQNRIYEGRLLEDDELLLSTVSKPATLLGIVNNKRLVGKLL